MAMEFKFRAKDGQPSTFRTQTSSSFTYFTEQALRAGIPNNKFGRSHDFFRNPGNMQMREVIQRELEKERIREEIIANEIARKRVLEAEVRRELMVEREMALRRGGDGFSFMSHRFEPRLPILHHPEPRSLEERIALSLEERLGQSSCRETGEFEMVPFQRHVEPKISEIKPLPEARKEKVIILDKPGTTLSGVKRKAVTPPAAGASEPLSVGSTKKPKEEWGCAICQVIATSERGLNEHLRGKKHQAKEAGLRAQKMGANVGLGLYPKKTTKLVKLGEITSNPISEQRVKVERTLPLLKKNSFTEREKNCEPLLHTEHDADDSVTGEHKKKNFRFWCEMCLVGAFSEKVMNNHKRGKKHRGHLLELYENGKAVLGTPKGKGSEDVAAEGTRKENNLEEVAEEETRVTPEEIDGVEAEVADNCSI